MRKKTNDKTKAVRLANILLEYNSFTEKEQLTDEQIGRSVKMWAEMVRLSKELAK